MRISSAELLKDGSTSTQPDFTIFTSAMEIDPEQENVVRMVGSSTERDLHGDTMAISALSDMTQVKPGLTIWLNHSYDLPHDLFGSLMESPRLELQDGIADIHIASDVETSNPLAVQTYGYIKKGKRLGCSIGCMILECELDEENDDGRSWFPPLIITHVQTLEWSVVGIPANQRCWAETGAKGLFERMASQGRGDEALALAPAVKGLYPRAYEDYLKTLNNEALRKDLERVKERPTPKQRVEWLPNERVFAMNTKGVYKPLKRDEVAALMEKGVEMPRIPQPAKETPQGIVARSVEGFDVGTALREGGAIESGKESNVNIIKEGDVVTMASTGEAAIVKSVDSQGGVTVKGKEVDQNIATSEEMAVQSTDNQGKITLKTQEETVPASVPLAQASTDPLKVQMYNLLASELGQPPLTLDAQGQIQATKAFPELSSEHIQEAIAKTLNFVDTVKGGSEFSKENREKLQTLHDGMVEMCKSSFHPCKEMMKDDPEDGDGPDSDGKPDDGDGDDDGDKQDATKAIGGEIVALRAEVGALIETLAKHGIDPKALKDLQGQISAAQRQLKDLQGQIKTAEEHLALLKNAPLGQPTLLKRGIQNNGDVVTYDELKALSAASMNANERRWSLDEALRDTNIVVRTLKSGETMSYRRWPAGVGGTVKDGVRPALTSMQRQWIFPGDVLAYNDGEEAFVPCYDDPAGIEA